MNDLGMVNYFLGIEVNQSKDGIFIFQAKYVKDMLKRFRMVNCKLLVTPIATGTYLNKNDEGSCVDTTLYKILVGSLRYLTIIRHDIMFVVSFILRFMESQKNPLAIWKKNPKICCWNNQLWCFVHIRFII
jgi:hypothetical protein